MPGRAGHDDSLRRPGRDAGRLDPSAAERPPPPASDPNNMWRAIALVALLLALIAALPEFDGRTGADWGEQSDDERR